MNKETWTGLSDQGKATWDKLSDLDKCQILQYASKQGEQSKPNTTVNFMEMESKVEQEDVEDMKVDNDNGIEANVHDATNQARNNAHPGDPRRMMGNQPHSNQVAQVKFMDWDTENNYGEDDLDHFVDAYWESDDKDSDSDFQEGD